MNRGYQRLAGSRIVLRDIRFPFAADSLPLRDRRHRLRCHRCRSRSRSFFLTTGVAAVSADFIGAEGADLAALTLVVVFGSSEPLPVAFFPPVVFTIAIALYRLCLEKNKTAEIF
ncbi:hypothetical protein [Paraburkholderia terrae]